MADTREKLFKREYAPQLLQIARGDLASAAGLSSIKAGRPENICYLAQQAIEKGIKAVLVWKQVAFPLVHDAGLLVAKLPKSCPHPPHSYDLSLMTQYATVRRYEEGYIGLTEEDIQGALAAAKEVLEWAGRQMGAEK